MSKSVFERLMSKKMNTESEQLAEFDLKHRVTGAAVLLFLGALVLPWLLGPPSEASKVDLTTDQPTVSGVEPAEIIVASDGSNVSPELSEIEETVYISKITPLDARRNASDAATKKNQPREQIQEAIQEKDTSAQESANALERLVNEQKAAAQSVAKEGNTSEKVKVETAKTSTNSADEETNSADEEQAKREQELQAALAAELKSQEPKVTSTKVASPLVSKANTVDVGWVVQVGLFTEKSRAIALIGELKNKGFQASSSVVDTNRGKKTGTRVWLGPFGKRASAVNEQNRLKSKAGKEGFIRVYP